LSGRLQVAFILTLVLVLSVSVLHLIIVGYVRERRARGDDKATTEKELKKAIAEKVWRTKVSRRR
jgi:hypothetical protein